MNLAERNIDLWDVATFDGELRARLDDAADTIRGYQTTSRKLWLEREASDHRSPYPENPFADAFMALREGLVPVMSQRNIRAWHYCRMTDAEVESIRQVGIRLSSVQTLRERLDAQVAAGAFDQAVADRLFDGSPFHSGQRTARLDKFWMVSHPAAIDDGGVEPLLGSWGGEGAYFWQQDEQLQALLRGIGRPRVLEVAVPLSLTRHAFSAGEAVVAAYGRSLGCRGGVEGVRSLHRDSPRTPGPDRGT